MKTIEPNEDDLAKQKIIELLKLKKIQEKFFYKTRNKDIVLILDAVGTNQFFGALWSIEFKLWEVGQWNECGELLGFKMRANSKKGNIEKIATQKDLAKIPLIKLADYKNSKNNDFVIYFSDLDYVYGKHKFNSIGDWQPMFVQIKHAQKKYPSWLDQ